MSTFRIERQIYFTLRVATAMCFIGHGAFGIITKTIWCNYFAVFGIGHDLAYRLMPVLGSFDIALGIGMLLYPVRAIPLWLIVWGGLTALLRPLSGEPFAEFFERAGNFGAPIIFLMLSGTNDKNFLTPMRKNICPDSKTFSHVLTGLKLFSFLLLAGHGWLNVIGKKGLIDQYLRLGAIHASETALAIGVCEIIVAFLVLAFPYRPLIFVVFIWKITSELFYPHYEFFEWIERGGSYGILFALWLGLRQKATVSIDSLPKEMASEF